MALEGDIPFGGRKGSSHGRCKQCACAPEFPQGAAIRRYNEVIGTAAKPILAGEWVEEARIQMPTPPEPDKLELATSVPSPAAVEVMQRAGQAG